MPTNPIWQRVRTAELGWEKRRETSVCLSLPPTLKHESWKSTWGPEKVSVPVYDCNPHPCFWAQAARASSVGLAGKHRLRRGGMIETG